MMIRHKKRATIRSKGCPYNGIEKVTVACITMIIVVRSEPHGTDFIVA